MLKGGSLFSSWFFGLSVVVICVLRELSREANGCAGVLRGLFVLDERMFIFSLFLYLKIIVVSALASERLFRIC
jgi:hypothetical protein